MTHRRDFVSLLGGAAAWPLAARAQQAQRLRRVAILAGAGGTDAYSPRAFRKEFARLGWMEGRIRHDPDPPRDPHPLLTLHRWGLEFHAQTVVSKPNVRPKHSFDRRMIEVMGHMRQ